MPYLPRPSLPFLTRCAHSAFPHFGPPSSPDARYFQLPMPVSPKAMRGTPRFLKAQGFLMHFERKSRGQHELPDLVPWSGTAAPPPEAVIPFPLVDMATSKESTRHEGHFRKPTPIPPHETSSCLQAASHCALSLRSLPGSAHHPHLIGRAQCLIESEVGNPCPSGRRLPCRHLCEGHAKSMDGVCSPWRPDPRQHLSPP